MPARSTSLVRAFCAGALALAVALPVATVAPSPASANPTVSGSSTGDSGLIWIPNYGQDSVVAIDAATMRKVHEVPMAGDHPMVAKMSSDGSKVFVGNFGPFDWSVTVIDTATAKIITKLPTLLPAYATITMSADGKSLYVPTAASVVHVYDTSTLKLKRTIPLFAPPGVAHIEVSPDDKYIYGYAATGQATRYDAHTGAVVGAPIFLNSFIPGWGAISQNGATQYAINYFTGVTTIDSATWTVTNTHVMTPLNAAPISATLNNPAGTELWVANIGASEIRVLDARTGVEKRRLKTPGGPIYVGFSDDGKTGYVSLVEDNPRLPRVDDLAFGHRLILSWLSKWVGTEGQLMKIDTRTFTTQATYRTKGVFVAGAYPH